MHRFNKIVYKEKYVTGQNGVLILENQEKIMLSYANDNTRLCYRCMVYLSRTSKTAKAVSIFCNESLIIFIFDPFPIIFHPNSHFPEALSLPMVIFLNGGSIQMAELVFPHDKQA